jgi:hypothetical protein
MGTNAHITVKTRLAPGAEYRAIAGQKVFGNIVAAAHRREKGFFHGESAALLLSTVNDQYIHPIYSPM